MKKMTYLMMLALGLLSVQTTNARVGDNLKRWVSGISKEKRNGIKENSKKAAIKIFLAGKTGGVVGAFNTAREEGRNALQRNLKENGASKEVIDAAGAKYDEVTKNSNSVKDEKAAVDLLNNATDTAMDAISG